MVASALIGFSLAALPEFSSRAPALPNICEPAKEINEDLSVLRTPSLVLFPFSGRGNSVDWFPVFNDSVAWPDDALVVRANYLGKNEDWKLFGYYARIQPGRLVFVYEPTHPGELHHLHYLGTAGELAARHASR